MGGAGRGAAVYQAAREVVGWREEEGARAAAAATTPTDPTPSSQGRPRRCGRLARRSGRRLGRTGRPKLEGEGWRRGEERGRREQRATPTRPTSPPLHQLELGHGLAGVDADRAEHLLCVVTREAAAALKEAAGTGGGGAGAGVARVDLAAWAGGGGEEGVGPDWRALVVR